MFATLLSIAGLLSSLQTGLPASQQTGGPQAEVASAHTLTVQVRSTVSGDYLGGIPISVVGSPYTAVTDHNGLAELAVTVGASGVGTVFSESARFTTAYCDVVFDQRIEHITLWKAPLRGLETPIIEPEVGGTFALTGLASPCSTLPEPVQVTLEVPPFALPERGRLSVSPLPYFASRPSAGRSFNLRTYPSSVMLAEFQLSFVDEQGKVFKEPEFSIPIQVEVAPWGFQMLGLWEAATPEIFGLAQLDRDRMQLETTTAAPLPLVASKSMRWSAAKGGHFGLYSSFYVGSLDQSLIGFSTGGPGDGDEPPPDPYDTWEYKLSYALTVLGWALDPAGEPVPVPGFVGDPRGAASGGGGASANPPEDGFPAVPLELDFEDSCQVKASASVACGNMSSGVVATCNQSSTLSINAEVMAGLSATLGVETGALAGLIASGSIELERSIQVGAGFGVTVGAISGGSASLGPSELTAAGGHVECLSGYVRAVVLNRQLSVSALGNEVDIPGANFCTKAGVVHDLSVSPDCSIPDASPPKDCEEGDAKPHADPFECN